MKIFSLLLLFFLGSRLLAQPHPKELLIGVPMVSEKNFGTVEHKLLTSAGVKLVAYCPTERVFALNLSDEVETATVMSSLQEFQELQFFVKEGTIESLMKNCSENLRKYNP
jgi:hypothetical protein